MNLKTKLLSLFVMCGFFYISLFAQTTVYNDSIRTLSLDYFYGRNGKYMDRQKGVFLALQAAESGNPRALCHVGYLYTEGKYLEKNDSLALLNFQRAANLGDSIAMDECGIRYAKGIGASKDPVKAFNLFLRAANLGYSNAAFNLGICYQKGEGTQQNDVEALKWYRKSAESNSPSGQYMLAKIYINGDLGVKQDLDQAYYWANIAAESGNLEALNLSGLLISGRKPLEAFEAFKKAFEGGDFYGRRNYADALRLGLGCNKNPFLAAEVYYNGYEKDKDPYCMYYLGILIIEEDMYIDTPDTRIEGKKAKKFAQQLIVDAAKQGFEKAQDYCNRHGIGIGNKKLSK